MIKRIALVGALAMAFGQPALADGKIYVQLPDLSSYEGQAAEAMLKRVVMANVVSSNCVDYEITSEDWSLLTDSADLLAYGQLKLDVNDYDDTYYKPAFDALDEPGTCETFGPDVEVVLDELVAHGGSREALPDQDKGYVEWRALMDRLEAEAQAAQPSAKVKSKS